MKLQIDEHVGRINPRVDWICGSNEPAGQAHLRSAQFQATAGRVKFSMFGFGVIRVEEHQFGYVLSMVWVWEQRLMINIGIEVKCEVSVINF